MSGAQRYLTEDRLERLASRLSDQDRQLIGLLATVHMASGDQLRRASSGDLESAEPASLRRQSRRRLAKLVELGVLSRLPRRIGGVRAGSAGFVYVLGPAGQRLSARWRGARAARGRRPVEPGERFVDHRLAVSELYVRLIEAAQTGNGELRDFQAEPACWRSFAGTWGQANWLKPDAFAGLGEDGDELLWFIEVDRGTVSSATVRRQVAAYLAYWRSGHRGDDVMPRVLWLVPDQWRRAHVQTIIDASGSPPGLFVVALIEHAVGWLAATTEARGGRS